jgi:uncharacterized damage-inducible protein DinB
MTQNLLIKRELLGDPELPAPISHSWAEFQKARDDTKHAVSGLSPSELVWRPHSRSNSIGMLLLHIAAVELDWMVRDVGRQQIDPRLAQHLLLEDAGSSPTLGDPGEQPLEWFVDKLDETRDITRRILGTLTEADLTSWRGADRPGVHYELQVGWILAHLIQHEAAHRGQIQMLKSLRRAMGS